MNTFSIKNPGYGVQIPAPIRKLLDRKKAEMAVGISNEDVLNAYNELPDLVKRESNMMFIPSHFKARKIYGLAPRPKKNLLQYSQRFDVSYWGKVNSSLKANSIANPINGAIDADLLIEDTSTGMHCVNTTVTAGIVLPKGTYTYSVYLKGLGRNFRLKLGRPDNTDTVSVFFNNDGTYQSGASTGLYSIENAGNGWYRFSVTRTFSQTLDANNSICLIQIVNGSTSNYTGDGTSGIYIWGAQLEKGSVATAYEPTNVSENLLKYSEQFDNGVWVKELGAITPNTIANPIDGAITADTYTADGTNGQHNVRQPVSVVAGNSYVFSVYVKAGTSNFVQLLYDNTFLGVNAYANFDLSTGAFSAGADVVPSVETLPNGWYRLSIKATATSSGSPKVNVYQVTSLSAARAEYATLSGTFYVYGAQVNYGSTALPYTKTTYSNTDEWVDHADFTFSRSSNAMIVGKDGLLQYAPHNLLQRSEEFDNAVWSKISTTVSANNTIAPDGTLTADRLIDGSSAATDYGISQATSIVAGQSYTCAVWVKYNGVRYVRLSFVGFASYVGGNPFAYFDFETGQISIVGSGSTASAVPYPDGWYRISVTSVASTTNSSSGISIYTATSTTSVTHDGDGVSGVYIWGAQVNAGSRLLDYVQTTSAAVYAPRFQYDPVTKKYQGLLMEKASTNLLTYSEDFSKWGVINATVSSNTIVAPDGSSSADKVVESTTVSSTFRQVSQAVSFIGIPDNAICVFSFFAKAGERDKVSIRLNDKENLNYPYAYFDLASGTVLSVQSGSTATIENFGNGWYRCSMTINVGAGTAASSLTCRIRPAIADNTDTYVGEAGKGLYIWGAQLEQSSVPTSYIPTLGASVTRAAEELKTTTFANWYNEEQGTIWADYIRNSSSSNIQGLFCVRSGSSNYVNYLRGGSSPGFNVYTNGVTTVGANLTGQPIGSRGKLVGTYKQGAYGASLNGDIVSNSDTDSPNTSPETVFIGSLDGYSHMDGTLKTIAYFPVRRSNDELQILTGGTPSGVPYTLPFTV